jgi:hypothetical protein
MSPFLQGLGLSGTSHQFSRRIGLGILVQTLGKGITFRMGDGQTWRSCPMRSLTHGFVHASQLNKFFVGDNFGEMKVTNAYGLLRSPWNLNSEPFVTRSDSVVGQSYMGGSLPGCSAIKSCFDSTTLSDMNTCLNGQVFFRQ